MVDLDLLLVPLGVDHEQVMELKEIVPRQAHSLNQGLPLGGGGEEQSQAQAQSHDQTNGGGQQ